MEMEEWRKWNIVKYLWGQEDLIVNCENVVGPRRKVWRNFLGTRFAVVLEWSWCIMNCFSNFKERKTQFLSSFPKLLLWDTLFFLFSLMKSFSSFLFFYFLPPPLLFCFLENCVLVHCCISINFSDLRETMG